MIDYHTSVSPALRQCHAVTYGFFDPPRSVGYTLSQEKQYLARLSLPQIKEGAEL